MPAERTPLPRISNEIPGESPMDALVETNPVEIDSKVSAEAPATLGAMYDQDSEAATPVETPHMDGHFSTIDQTVAKNGSHRYYGVDAEGKKHAVSAGSILENYGHDGDYQGKEVNAETTSSEKSKERWLVRSASRVGQLAERVSESMGKRRTVREWFRDGRKRAAEVGRTVLGNISDIKEARSEAKGYRKQARIRDLEKHESRRLEAQRSYQLGIEATKARMAEQAEAARQRKAERRSQRGGLRQGVKDYFKYRKLAKERQAYHAETDRLETETLERLYKADEVEAKNSERAAAGKLIELAWGEALRAEEAGDEEAVQEALKAAMIAESLDILHDDEEK